MTNEESDKLKRLYEFYEQPMYRIAFSVLHNSELAEDAVSDAFERIIKKIHNFKEIPSDKTKSYIVKIIKSTSINIYRKNKRTVEREIPIDDEMFQYEDIGQDVEIDIIRKESKKSIFSMLKKLGETDEKIVILRCLKELSWKEVAEKMSITEVSARKRFERSRKRLISMKGEIDDE